MGYRSNVRMVIQGPKELILAGFAALALTGDSVMQEALKEWGLREDGVQVTGGELDIPLAVAILGRGGVDWKWYDSYSEIQEIQAWFDWLEDEEENPHKPKEYARDKDNKPIMEDCPAFGGIRIGEDSTDIQEWGYPSDFDLYVSVAIQTPY